MKKATTRLLSAMLLLVLLLSSFPFAVIAEPLGSESKDTVNTDAPLEIREPDKQVGSSGEPESVEIINRRERNVKHFRHEDGTVEAVIYGYAVHRLDEAGKWQDIDNRLTEKTDSRTIHYVTNDERIHFSNSGIGQLTLTLDSKPYRITMGMLTDRLQSGSISADSSTQPQIVVRNHETRAEQTTQATSELSRDAQIERLKVIDNRTELCYQNIQNDIHLKYELEADDIKETIVVNAPQSEYRYQFGLRLEGLTATLCADGGIDLTDIETGDIPYRIPAPYMVDANDAVSHDVVYTLETIGEGAYLLTVIADSMWIDAKNRAFPVSIDPSLSTVGFTDTYIEDNHPDTIHGSDATLWVGQTKYSFLKTDLVSSIPRNSVINYAYLDIYYYYYSSVTSGTFKLGMYRAINSWNESLTWNTAKNRTNMGLDTTCLYTVNLSGSRGAYYSSPQKATLNMKNIVQSWVNGTVNYGIVLKRDSGDLMHSIICSSDGRTAYRPKLILQYTEPKVEEGTYRLRNLKNGLYLSVGGEYCWIEGAPLQQKSRSSMENWHEESRKQLFKITYIDEYGDDQYYSIRLMTNSVMALTAPLSGNRAVTATSVPRTDEWFDFDQTERWFIRKNQSGGYVTIKNAFTDNGGFLTAASNSISGAAVSATSSESDYSHWVLERYTGTPIEGSFLTSFTKTVTVGETFNKFEGCMYSSTPGINGPVIFSVENLRFSTITRAHISLDGVLEASYPGKINVIVKFNNSADGYDDYYIGWYCVWVMLPQSEMFLQNATDSNQYLQIEDSYAPSFDSENAGIEGNKFLAGRHQKWEINPISGTPYYMIKNKASQKVLTVPAGKATVENVQLTQTAYSGSENQQWEIDAVRTGRYIIRPRLNPEQMCVATADIGKKVQQRLCKTDNNSYREEWRMNNANAPYVTKDIIFYYDKNVLKASDIPTIEDLTIFLQETLDIYMDRFNLKFNIKAVLPAEELEWHPRSEIEGGCAAVTVWDTCTPECGPTSSCETTHHKSGARLCKVLSNSDPNIYVCRIVSYSLCKYSESEGHKNNLMKGCTDGIGGNSRNSIVSFLFPDSEDRTSQRRQVILHELSHNLGCYHCNNHGCITFNSVNGSSVWCPDHDTYIRNLLY